MNGRTIGLLVAGGVALGGIVTTALVIWLLRAGPKQPTGSIVAAPVVGEAGRAQQALIDKGRNLSMYLGCNACHSTDGTRMQGASWLGLYGSQIKLTDGRTVTADETFLRRAIVNPGAETHEGFANVMLPYDDLKEEQLDALVAYIRSFAK